MCHGPSDSINLIGDQYSILVAVADEKTKKAGFHVGPIGESRPKCHWSLTLPRICTHSWGVRWLWGRQGESMYNMACCVIHLMASRAHQDEEVWISYLCGFTLRSRNFRPCFRIILPFLLELWWIFQKPVSLNKLSKAGCSNCLMYRVSWNEWYIFMRRV